MEIFPLLAKVKRAMLPALPQDPLQIQMPPPKAVFPSLLPPPNQLPLLNPLPLPSLLIQTLPKQIPLIGLLIAIPLKTLVSNFPAPGALPVLLVM